MLELILGFYVLVILFILLLPEIIIGAVLFFNWIDRVSDEKYRKSKQKKYMQNPAMRNNCGQNMAGGRNMGQVPFRSGNVNRQTTSLRSFSSTRNTSWADDDDDDDYYELQREAQRRYEEERRWEQERLEEERRRELENDRMMWDTLINLDRPDDPYY